ncbi:MAG: hypothetical protein ABFS46_15495, partial [Myxococcota bacterium]
RKPPTPRKAAAPVRTRTAPSAARRSAPPRSTGVKTRREKVQIAAPLTLPRPEAKPTAPPPASVAAKLPRRVGLVTHYFPHVDAGIVAVDAASIRVGDTLHFKGHTTDFYQRVDRMERDHHPIEMATPGMQVGIHVTQRVREHDEVFVVT